MSTLTKLLPATTRSIDVFMQGYTGSMEKNHKIAWFTKTGLLKELEKLKEGIKKFITPKGLAEFAVIAATTPYTWEHLLAHLIARAVRIFKRKVKKIIDERRRRQLPGPVPVATFADMTQEIADAVVPKHTWGKITGGTNSVVGTHGPTVIKTFTPDIEIKLGPAPKVGKPEYFGWSNIGSVRTHTSIKPFDSVSAISSKPSGIEMPFEFQGFKSYNRKISKK